MAQKLKAIIPPLLTPLTDGFNLDVSAVNRLIEHLILGGVHGVFILGTTGEATGLRYDVRQEMIKETVLMGGDGGVNGGANLFPRLYVALYQASLDRDFQRMEQLQKQVMEVARMLYNIGKYGSSYLKGLKGAASLLGLCSPYLAPPFKQFKELEMEVISNNLKEIQSNIEKLGLSGHTQKYI
ncbi:4-hydroxy-tetrahydrodipicolinate synthase [Arenibacter antarcticus]|uniref:Dihydrodipicolinate synthase family protein n=1 Tax=Arenibacter antarcticus TaxID=2040469 RepID=A0ABW5VE39_9FLAO|nr:dihydrodipicolinate synthase family protein [Arenibacter sp. H213]MCM4167484.1 hypothetical protein [Arenibacter sp. H213]